MCPYSCFDMLAVSPCDLHFLSLFGVAFLSLSQFPFSPVAATVTQSRRVVRERGGKGDGGGGKGQFLSPTDGDGR